MITAKSSPQPNLTGLEITPRLWVFVLLTGAGGGLFGGLLMRLLRATQHLAFSYRSGEFLAAVEHTSAAHRVLVLTAAGLFAGVVLYTLRRLTGRHGPALSEAIWCKAGDLPLVSTGVRAVLAIMLVGMGAAVGREAALKQTGALVGAKLSDWTKLTASQRHFLAACGAGAGLAAAYNVPFGGALFALEVLLGSLELPLVLIAFAASFVGTAVSWIFLPNKPTYTVSPTATSISLLIWALIAGPIAGLISVGYVRALGWATSDKPKGWRIIAFPLLAFAALGASAILFPQLLGNGKDVVQLTLLDQFVTPLLLALLILRPLATFMCLRSGIPGGLFTPTMTFGALLGAVLGHAWNIFWPGPTLGAQAMLGSVAVLAAAMQGPICAIVLLLELTHSGTALMVPILIVVAGATLTSRALHSQSIYSVKVHH